MITFVIEYRYLWIDTTFILPLSTEKEIHLWEMYLIKYIKFIFRFKIDVLDTVTEKLSI